MAKVSFNPEVVKKLSKDQFKEAAKHHENDCDLDAEYHAIVPAIKSKKQDANPDDKVVV